MQLTKTSQICLIQWSHSIHIFLCDSILFSYSLNVTSSLQTSANSPVHHDNYYDDDNGNDDDTGDEKGDDDGDDDVEDDDNGFD